MSVFFPPFLKNYLSTLKGKGAERGLLLLSMVVVRQHWGQESLGVYTFVISLFFVTEILICFGLPHYIEVVSAKTNLSKEETLNLFRSSSVAVIFTSLIASLCFQYFPP